MFHELILICSSISGVITALPELVLANGSVDCIPKTLCKHRYSEGYTCKVAGSTQDVQVTNCEALNIHYDRWTREETPLDTP